MDMQVTYNFSHNSIFTVPCARTPVQSSADDVEASVAWAQSLFTGSNSGNDSGLQRLLSLAAESVRSIFDERSARDWAKGFVIPGELIFNDVQCLVTAQLDFVAMVRKRYESTSPDRLNATRVMGLCSCNPEIPLLLDLAKGMRVHLPTDFTPNGQQNPTPLRKTYLAVAPAVNKMLCELVQQRLAFLIPYDLARQHVPNLHLAKAHWTRKKGKPSGRPLGDLTFVDGSPLNTPETADLASAFYGDICHPTIEDICRMINDFWIKTVLLDPTASWDDIILWKMDLRGAYTLLSYRPEDVGLLGMMLTDNTVYFQTAGIFGWAGTPAAFQVVTRAIKYELSTALHSSTLMYVDDVVGVGRAEFIQSDLATTRLICTNLLGPTAIADDKTEQGRRVDIIGYTVDLDLRRVLIAEKNFLTALHGFSTVRIDKPINIKTAQRLASWASRYGKICRIMRPFCGALNRLCTGRTQPHAAFAVSTEAQIAIRCWRAMLYLAKTRETEFTRTLDSFSPSHPSVVAVFDSSLQGVGVIWYTIHNGAELPSGVCAVDTSSLDFADDSTYQNLSEFIGAIVAVAGHAMHGMYGQSIMLRGDSITALTWALTERSRGAIVTKAAMVWAQLCIATDTNVSEVQHIPGTENHLCDSLSRRGLSETRSVAQHANDLGLGGARVLSIQDDPDVMPLIQLCNPVPALDTEQLFTEFWGKVRAHIDSLVIRHPRSLPRPNT
jgi:hypothetical protein